MPRASAPVVGALVLLAVTVVLSAAVGVVALDVPSPPEPAPAVSLSASAAADGTVALVHEAGPPLDVREIRLRIEVNGTPLAHQPPIPFFSATGFRSGPTGPFNVAADPTWNPGERASLRIAATNSPAPSAGATVSVRVYRDDLPVAAAEAVA